MSVASRPSDAAFLVRLQEAARETEPYRKALDLTVEHFRAESGTIHILAQGELQLRAHTAGMPPAVLDVIRRIPVGKGMAGLAVERRAPVTACNLQTDTSGDVRPGARATGLAGSIVVPILRSGEQPESRDVPEVPVVPVVIGALGIANRAERTFTEAETALLLEAGRRIANWSDAAG